MELYDSFLLYSSEDIQLASELAGSLKSRGFKFWYAPIELKVGSKLLDSIEQGMQNSRSGILLISKSYLRKGWTNYEMDVLIRQSIDSSKKLLPIWHEVTKEEVEKRHLGLAGIVALRSEQGLQATTSRLTEVLAEGAPTRGVIPSWESPKWRFLQGRGEVNIGSNEGPATTLWELLVHAEDSQYPVYLDGQVFTRQELLLQAAMLLPHIPDEVENWVGRGGKTKLWTMCKEAGFDPHLFE